MNDWIELVNKNMKIMGEILKQLTARIEALETKLEVKNESKD